MSTAQARQNSLALLAGSSDRKSVSSGRAAAAAQTAAAAASRGRRSTIYFAEHQEQNNENQTTEPSLSLAAPAAVNARLSMSHSPTPRMPRISSVHESHTSDFHEMD